jgi:hypothetical protein
VDNAHIVCDDYDLVCHAPTTDTMNLCQTALDRFIYDNPDDAYDFITGLAEYDASKIFGWRLGFSSVC